MPGAIFFIVIVAVGVVVAAFTGTIFLLIPFVVIALGVVFAVPVLAALRGTELEPGAEPSRVPSTEEASYEPVQQPRQP
jgi:hypothetical protein